MVSWKKISFWVTTIGSVFFIALGISLLVAVIPKALEKKLKEKLPIREGSDSAKRFIESSVPSYVKFYVFNITNKDEVNNHGSKAKLQELGPYIYRQYKVKIDVNFGAKFEDVRSGLVSYREFTRYEFEPDMSKGKLTDEVNHLNVFSIVIANKESLLRMLDVKAERLPGQFVETHTVGELLFDGYDIRPSFGPVDQNKIVGICHLISCNFSIYQENNNKTSKVFIVSSGTEKLQDIGKVLAYDGEKSLDVWYNDTCNAINGSDGKQFSPSVQNEDIKYVFSADVCRSFKFVYDKDVVVQKIDAKRFVIPPEVFGDPNINRDNMCFCPVDPCPSKAGVFSVEKCKGDKPIAMSGPHFYLGEDEYIDNFEGLNPSKSEHETYLDIETVTGAVISGAKRLQVNVIVTPGKARFLRHVQKSMYFPVVWLEEGATIDELSAEKFREEVTNKIKLGKWSSIAMIGIAAVVLLLISLYIIYKTVNSARSEARELQSDVYLDEKEKFSAEYPPQDQKPGIKPEFSHSFVKPQYSEMKPSESEDLIFTPRRMDASASKV